MTDNIYSAPESNINEVSEGDDAIMQFPRFSAWAVFGLGIITLGIYTLFWFYNRLTVVNKNHTKPIAMGLFWAYIALSVLSNGMSFSESWMLFASLFTVAGMIVYFVMIYTLRARLIDLIESAEVTNLSKIGGVMTFFFSIIYLQFKINEAIDAKNQS
tara:strand:+ start:72 stop:545 length:474 start_codon:yes stop_codon:yes gene_type:complete